MKLSKMSRQLHELQFQDVMLIFLEVKILKKKFSNFSAFNRTKMLRCSSAAALQQHVVEVPVSVL